MWDKYNYDIATYSVKIHKKFDYDTRLKKLGLTTVEKRCMKGDLIETFKILTDHEKISKQDFFDVRQGTIIYVDIPIHLKSKEVESISGRTFLVNVQSSSGAVYLSMLSLPAP